ncbi:MAG: hypothetical protein ACOYOV_11120 [Bacteroidales bacterium]
MSGFKDELKELKTKEFRPEKWKEIIRENTGYSEIYITQVFYGHRFNKVIALAIISLFATELKREQQLIEEAKK